MLLFGLTAVAKPVDQAAARQVATNFWNAHRDKGVAAVNSPMTLIGSEFDAFYIFGGGQYYQGNKGANPVSYINTTDGVTYYYGYDPFNGEIDKNSVLRTDNGYIGYWALTCIMDQFSNYVHYWNVNDNNEIAPAQ